MSYKPQRQFNGTVGEPSRDTGGPDMIERDIDEINKMFDPDSTHTDGQPGGISTDNLNFTPVIAQSGKGLSTNDFTNAYKTKVDQNTSARHTHGNKGVLDGISGALVSAWTSASDWVSAQGTSVASHLSDTVKHITSTERTNWNSVVTWITTNGANILSHLSNTVKHVTSTERTNWNSVVTWITTNGANILSHLSNTVKHITSTERSTWNAKQDTIPDLATIRQNASDGADHAGAVGNPHNTTAGDLNAIEEPANEGTAGQFLMTDGDGGRSWATPSGGGGTNNYNDLANKPKINSVELAGNKSLADLGIVIPTKTSDLTNDSGFLTQHQSLAAYRTSADQDTIDNGKVDKTNAGIQAGIKLLNTSTVNPADDSKIIVGTTAADPVYTVRKFSNVWGYIKGKADAVYAAIAHTHALTDASVTGTLPVSKGGTGVATVTAGYVLVGDDTNAMVARAVVDTEVTSTYSVNNRLFTLTTLNSLLKRNDAVNHANTGYTTYMARGIALFNTDTNPTANGCISFTYK